MKKNFFSIKNFVIQENGFVFYQNIFIFKKFLSPSSVFSCKKIRFYSIKKMVSVKFFIQ